MCEGHRQRTFALKGTRLTLWPTPASFSLPRSLSLIGRRPHYPATVRGRRQLPPFACIHLPERVQLARLPLYLSLSFFSTHALTLAPFHCSHPLRHLLSFIYFSLCSHCSLSLLSSSHQSICPFIANSSHSLSHSY